MVDVRNSMPIIDPSLQCFLIQNIEKTELKEDYTLILKYLSIAMKNISRNLHTLECSLKFKNDFKRNLSSINDEFGCNINYQHLNKYRGNFYKYLSNRLQIRNKREESNKIRGKYDICNDYSNTRFFEPNIIYSNFRRWYFTDSPIAILSINSELLDRININEENKRHLIQIMQLEVDLIHSSNLTLVLCVNYSPSIDEFLLPILKDNQFSELHLDIFNDKHKKTFLRRYQDKIGKVLSKLKFIPTKPFRHCKTGFRQSNLRIFLDYVPLFEGEEESSSFIPSEVSEHCIGYIKSEEFLRKRFSRVKVLIEEEDNEHRHIFKYVNFEDIHGVRAELFVEDSLLLTKIDESEIETLNRIKTNIDLQIEKGNQFQRKYLLELLIGNRFEECLQYVTFAYSTNIRSSLPDFAIHRSQIYAALEACQTFFRRVKDDEGQEKKGVIYQVETGEGKSCIVCLIAAVLAIKKYTVHIASSNIKLSNRDYYNSYEFFRIFGFKSAVLLHKNELPFSSTGINSEDKEDEGVENRIPLQDFSQDEDTYFKSNADYYYEINSKKDYESYRIKYPDKYFGNELFKNPSRMNFSVCGIDNNNNKSENKADIIFSTFVNFECFYLHLMEQCPGYIDKYYKKCGLLIDEADSILIDEITNGTIISRDMRSNAKEILSKVYNNKQSNKTAKETFQELHQNVMCSDIKLSDVEEMYKEIDLVFNEEYCDGVRYCVETFEVKNNHRIRNFIRKTIKTVLNARDKLGELIDEKICEKDKDDGDFDAGDGDEDEDSEFDTRKSRKFSTIVPFDYNHKGIHEPNKEFSGFIQQFISLKESLINKNKDIIFKDISMSYLYISHPIFAKLYPKICGFTGTVGDKEDKRIYEEEYHLITKKVPRNKPCFRVKFPTIFCSSIEERNEKIVREVIEFHNKGYPVLVIFQELNEIEEVQRMLYERGIRYINIFNGKEEHISPDRIAGIKGSISLGTNVCGRGTDIQTREFPLHVIVSFHSSNIRVMEQAYGRTARQGKKGTCRCICLISQFLKNNRIFNISRTQRKISDFEYKILEQRNFIEYYKKNRPWIFDFNIDKQQIPEKYIIKLRKTRINVNRIVAYKYKFPICMSIETFLTIQSQRIFSIFNCPNGKYTWRLFQRYVREMLLESWSLMIVKVDQLFSSKENRLSYKEILDDQIIYLHKQLQKYLPAKHTSIVSTFMHIHKKVRHKYQSKLLKSFKKIKKAYLSFGETNFTLFQLGFKPYSLLSRSGSRINYSNIGETNYIEDPELKYEQRMPDNTFSILSITERIDKIFNAIFQKISSTLGEKVFIKFFLRRTLGGCEFGVCFDINLINYDDSVIKEKYFLIDKDPLLVFTIFLWSMVPLMAGILIFVLVYLTGVAKKIIEWVEGFPAKISEEVLKQGVLTVINLMVPEVCTFFLDRVISYLESVLDKQLKELGDKEKEIIEEIKNIFLCHEFEKTGEFISSKISSILGGIIRFPGNLGSLLKDSISVSHLMKIGFLLLLCLGTYVKKFISRKLALKHAEDNANSYDSTFDKPKENQNQSQNQDQIQNQSTGEVDPTDTKLNEILDNEKIDGTLDDIRKPEKWEIDEFEESYNEVSTTYIYKFKTLNLSKYEIKKTDLQELEKINYCNGDGQVVIIKSRNMKCIEMKFYHEDINLIDSVRLYGVNVHPAISPFYGYRLDDIYFNIYVENKENGFLDEYIRKNNKFNATDRLIISYGIACALEFLHNRGYILWQLVPNNILLDSHLYPYIYRFNIDSNDKTSTMPIEAQYSFFAPPESYNVTEKLNSFKIDVFAFGMTLFYMIFRMSNYKKKSSHYMKDMISSGHRPQFPESENSQWKNLIERCWNQDPNQRPDFSEICDLLESEVFVNSSINRVAFSDYMKIIRPFRSIPK